MFRLSLHLRRLTMKTKTPLRLLSRTLSSPPPGESIWSTLAGSDELQLIKFLRKGESHKAQIEAEDSAGMVPLHHTALNGQIGLMMTLLAAGASVAREDPQGRSALTFAAIGNKKHAVALLLQMGAEPLQQDKDLYYAFDYTSDPSIDALLNHTAKGYSSAELTDYEREAAQAQEAAPGPKAGSHDRVPAFQEDALAYSVDPLAPSLSAAPPPAAPAAPSAPPVQHVNAAADAAAAKARPHAKKKKAGSAGATRSTANAHASASANANNGVGLDTDGLVVPSMMVASLIGADGCTTMEATGSELQPGVGVGGAFAAEDGINSEAEVAEGKKGDTVLGQWD